MRFGQSISTCYSKYTDFEGRASRSEYWWFYLFQSLCTLPLNSPSLNIGFSLFLAVFLFLIPFCAVGTRRLHDTGRSGWNQLWVFTIIGSIPLLIWLASKGDESSNSYGDSAVTPKLDENKWDGVKPMGRILERKNWADAQTRSRLTNEFIRFLTGDY